MNSADNLRFRMADRPQLAIETYLGDGTASAYQISGVPIVTGGTALGGRSLNVEIRNANGDSWTATSLMATSLALGLITFAQPIPFGFPFQVTYTFATFSDSEIDEFTAASPGDLNGQKIGMIDVLLVDYAKRSRWNAQGVSMDDSVVFQNLLKLREELWKQMTQEIGPQGGLVSWAEGQQYTP